MRFWCGSIFMFSVFVEPGCVAELMDARAPGEVGSMQRLFSDYLIHLGGISSITIWKTSESYNHIKITGIQREIAPNRQLSDPPHSPSQIYQTQTQKASTADPRTSPKKLHNCMDNKHYSLVSLQLHSLRNSICNAFVSFTGIGRPSIQRLNKTSQQFACVFVATLFHYCFIALLVYYIVHSNNHLSCGALSCLVEARAASRFAVFVVTSQGILHGVSERLSISHSSN